MPSCEGNCGGPCERARAFRGAYLGSEGSLFGEGRGGWMGGIRLHLLCWEGGKWRNSSVMWRGCMHVMVLVCDQGPKSDESRARKSM
jgi:hypothetical protein